MSDKSKDQEKKLKDDPSEKKDTLKKTGADEDDIDILKKYGLDQYDGYELLKRSSGKLPIDTYEFIDPIFPDDETSAGTFFV